MDSGATEQRPGRRRGDPAATRVGDPAWGVVLVVALVAYAALAFGYVTLTPIWQNPDEPAHYNYVAFVAETGGLPVLRPGDWDSALLERLKNGRLQPGDDVGAIRYEGWQPPLYYLAAAPLFRLGPLDEPRVQLVRLRAFDAVLGALTVVVGYLVAREVLPAHLAVGVPLLLVGVPMFTAVSSAVSADPLANLLAAGLLLVLVRRWRADSRAAAPADRGSALASAPGAASDQHARSATDHAGRSATDDGGRPAAARSARDPAGRSAMEDASRSAAERATRSATDHFAAEQAGQANRSVADQPGGSATDHAGRSAMEDASCSAAECASRSAADHFAAEQAGQANRSVADQPGGSATNHAGRSVTNHSAAEQAGQANRSVADQPPRSATDQGGRSAVDHADGSAADQAGGAAGATWAVGAGVLLGLGLLTKLALGIFVPLALLTLLVRASRPVRDSLLLLCAAGLTVLPWLVHQVTSYGWADPLATSRHAAVVLDQPRFPGLSLPFIGAFLTTTFHSFWAQFGWMGVVAPDRLYWVWGLAVLLALGGLLMEHRKLLREPLWRLLQATLGVAVLAYIGYNLTFQQAQGRYLFTALVPIAMLLVLGWARWLPRPIQGWGIVLVGLGLVSLNAYALLRVLVPGFAPTG